MSQLSHKRTNHHGPKSTFVRSGPIATKFCSAAKCRDVPFASFDIWFGMKEPRHIGGSKCDGRGFERGSKGQTKKPCSELNCTICAVSDQNGASRRMTRSAIRRQRTAKEKTASRRATYAQFANLIMSFRVRITLPPTTGALTKL
jgi:hypothetical protein